MNTIILFFHKIITTRNLAVVLFVICLHTNFAVAQYGKYILNHTLMM
jgi:hypothetical protein